MNPLTRLLLLACLPLPVIAGSSEPAPVAPSTPAYILDYNAGTKLLRAKKFAAAQPLLEAAIAAKSDYAEAHNNLAYVLRKQGAANFPTALEHYTRAIALKPTLPQPYMYRGVLFVQLDRLDDARADLATLKSLQSSLASELAWVIENRKEKEPEQFFGVTR
jgi:hypothetical protein